MLYWNFVICSKLIVLLCKGEYYMPIAAGVRGARARPQGRLGLGLPPGLGPGPGLEPGSCILGLKG